MWEAEPVWVLLWSLQCKMIWYRTGVRHEVYQWHLGNTQLRFTDPVTAEAPDINHRGKRWYRKVCQCYTVTQRDANNPTILIRHAESIWFSSEPLPARQRRTFSTAQINVFISSYSPLLLKTRFQHSSVRHHWIILINLVVTECKPQPSPNSPAPDVSGGNPWQMYVLLYTIMFFDAGAVWGAGSL